jgi:4-hydroxy-3-polyprenylbenzoate decarboxylase
LAIERQPGKLDAMSAHPTRLTVGITGATGIQYGARVLELLRETAIETHLVVSRAGDMTYAALAR